MADPGMPLFAHRAHEPAATAPRTVNEEQVTASDSATNPLPARSTTRPARSRLCVEQPEITPRLLTVDQAAHVLQVSRRTVYRLIAEGRLPPPVSVRGASRVRVDDIDRYLQSITRERGS